MEIGDSNRNSNRVHSNMEDMEWEEEKGREEKMTE